MTTDEMSEAVTNNEQEDPEVGVGDDQDVGVDQDVAVEAIGAVTNDKMSKAVTKHDQEDT